MDEHKPDAAAIDEFAQTRGVDDLFDDEIIPVSAEQQAQQFEELKEDRTEERGSDAKTEGENPPQQVRGGDRGRGRGRGRGGRGGRASYDRGPTRAEAAAKSKQVEKNAEGSDKDADVTAEGAQDDKSVEEDKGKTEGAASVSRPSDPSNGPETPRVQAVRGDRSGTGGIKKPKLTEDELSARMAAAKLNAAKIAAAHARAEADQASFQEREKMAAEKKRQEFQNRRVMDGERERNRLRKLGAQTGREWDVEKREEDYDPRGGSSQYRRGMHGGVSGYTRHGSENGAEVEEGYNNNYRGRGRGGRGGRGRGGHLGGRGNHLASNGAHDNPSVRASPTPSAPVISNDSDFPALPGSSKQETDAPGPTVFTSTTSASETPAPNVDKSPSPLSPLTPSGGSWAEQVESSRAAKA